MRVQEEQPSPKPSSWKKLIGQLVTRFGDDLFFIAAATIAAIVRAMGTTIESGWTGLRFTMGKADKVLQPGFHPLIPFLMRVRRMPTRSRTLDLPAQRVATFEGLVYHVDANVVYRVVDVRKALIQIDRLEKGMIQMLGLGVQEVLRVMPRERLATGEGLGEALERNLAARLEPWGVAVESAGFPTITPSPKSLRITQLDAVVDQRSRIRHLLLDGGVETRGALPLIGTRVVHRPKRRKLMSDARHRERLRRIRAKLKKRKWTGSQIQRAELRLRIRARRRALRR